MRIYSYWISNSFRNRCFIIIIGIPFLLLLLAGAIVAMCVFGVLMLFHLGKMKIRQLFPSNEGRKNVRVIRREDH